MRRGTSRAAILSGVGAGIAIVRKLASSLPSQRKHSDGDTGRWRVVTVNLPPEEVVPERLEPLARLGDTIEVVTRPAPGGRGTELAARLKGGDPCGLESLVSRVSGDDPRQAVRSALRQAKQLLETGEVLEANENIANKPTVTGVPIDVATERAGGEGRL